jgi:hypothetical protein
MSYYTVILHQRYPPSLVELCGGIQPEYEQTILGAYATLAFFFSSLLGNPANGIVERVDSCIMQ